MLRSPDQYERSVGPQPDQSEGQTATPKDRVRRQDLFKSLELTQIGSVEPEILSFVIFGTLFLLPVWHFHFRYPKRSRPTSGPIQITLDDANRLSTTGATASQLKCRHQQQQQHQRNSIGNIGQS